jgi:hypothetical protein
MTPGRPAGIPHADASPHPAAGGHHAECAACRAPWRFYGTALAPLGFAVVIEVADVLAEEFGVDGKPTFWIYLVVGPLPLDLAFPLAGIGASTRSTRLR